MCVHATKKKCDRKGEQEKQRNAERADIEELFTSNLYLSLDKDMTEKEQARSSSRPKGLNLDFFK